MEMTILDDFLEIAAKEKGVSEIPGGNNPRIVFYDSFTSLGAKNDEVAWCSAFVNYVVTEAGLHGTDSASARSWLSWSDGKQIEIPISGCIVVLKRGNNPQEGHVAFYLGKHGDSLLLRGGNQGDKVCDEYFLAQNLLAYIVPKTFNE
jgi:uncharacterized protein (TIGR02594 family)